MSFRRVSALILGASVLLSAASARATEPALPRTVSPFFPSLDELCQTVRATPEASFRDDVRAYCSNRSDVPAFAAIREEERIAILDEQRACAKLGPTRLLSLPPLPPVRSLVELAALPVDAKPPGVLTLKALALTLHEVCSPKAVLETLPSTCTSPNRLPFSLGSVRSALVDDAGGLAQRALDRLAQVPAVERVISILTLLVGILQNDDIPHLLSRLSQIAERKVGDASGSALVGATAATATEVAVRLLRDGPLFDRPKAHYERVVASVLAERVRLGAFPATPLAGRYLGFPGQGPSAPAAPAPLRPEQAEATSRLISAFGTLEVGRRQATQHPASAEQIGAIALASLDVVAAAYELAGQETVRPISPEVRTVIARVAGSAATGDVRVLADVLADQIDTLEKNGVLSSTAACSSKTALRVAFTRSDAETQRALLTCVVELPPWTDKLLFAAHAGLPVLNAGTTRIDGDLLLGYNGATFGISGFGSIYNYDVTDQTGRSETFRAEGSGDVWGSVKVGERVRLEGRLSGGGALYNTDVYPAARGYYEETSLMGRGSALVGLRIVPSARFVVAAHGGGGLQVELWDGTQIPSNGRRIVFTDEVPITARAVGRVRAQWTTWPSVFSLRLAADVDYLSITRAREVSTLGPNGLAATISETSLRQIELFARGYVDLDILELLSFRPVIHGGTNVISVGGDMAVVPVFGIGIRRESF